MAFSGELKLISYPLLGIYLGNNEALHPPGAKKTPINWIRTTMDDVSFNLIVRVGWQTLLYFK
jgi:hypothetical protein